MPTNRKRSSSAIPRATIKLPLAIQSSLSAGAESLYPVAGVLGKRSSRLRSSISEEENDKLAKRLKTELYISESRKARKLKNITNTVEQQTVSPEVVAVETKKRKRDGQSSVSEREDDRKRLKSNEGDTAVVTQSQEKLTEALGKHYFDAKNRLNLDYVPECLRNVSRCAAFHARRTNQARRVNCRRQRDTKELLIEHRPMHFLEYLEQALLRNEFIDAHLFTKALELILTINKPSQQLNADYNICSLLQQTVDVLDRTVEQFPPCWLDLKTSYQNIMFGTLEEVCFMKYDRSEGLFKVVLFLLERCVEDGEREHNVTRTLSAERSSMASFYHWELENNQKYDFELLSREDKLERLFLVVQILVKILELDLSMWILRHPHNAKENMIKQTRKPLVASLLWNEHSTVGEVNSDIKRIIDLYVNVVALNYPKEDIQVVSRFISVIGTAINLSEIQYNGTVDYPCIKDNTRYFVRQISRLVEASNYYSVSLCLRSIQQMRSPLIRMCMVGDFLQKLNHLIDAPSVVSYMKHLAKGKWKEYRLNTTLESSSKTPADRYSFLDSRKQRKCSHEISRSQYVNLLLEGFQSYMGVYPVQFYFKSFKLTAPPSLSSNSSSSISPRRPTRNQLKTHRYDFAALEKNIKKLCKQRKLNKTIVNHTQDTTIGPMILEEVNVSPAMLVYYRDEVKYLMLIQRWLQTKASGSDEERKLFAPWRRYLAQIDETLACE